jgi:hypothetical protein
MSGQSGGDVDWDVVFDALADQMRRAVLRSLVAKPGGRIEQRLLAYSLATDEASETSAGSYKQVLVKLHHVHLPKLQRAHLVEWNRETGVVARTELAGLLPLLVLDPARIVEESDSPVQHAGD